MSHIVQVVSMLDVMMRLGDNVFQSRDVRGAVCSGDFELESKASGVSFCTLVSPMFVGRVMELLGLWNLGAGSDHKRRWSPDEAKRSQVFFCDDSGSHNIRVTGKECAASADLLNSIPNCEAPASASGSSSGTICVSRIEILLSKCQRCSEWVFRLLLT